VDSVLMQKALGEGEPEMQVLMRAGWTFNRSVDCVKIWRRRAA
jgi:hypothetical protein